VLRGKGKPTSGKYPSPVGEIVLANGEPKRLAEDE
jgi:hypothetical protein